jgi:hypothetical protein
VSKTTVKKEKSTFAQPLPIEFSSQDFKQEGGGGTTLTSSTKMHLCLKVFTKN